MNHEQPAFFMPDSYVLMCINAHVNMLKYP